jgi:hypothetical protein
MKENAWCCGAGGGVRDAYKDFALWAASERLEEAKAAGAEAIVSACPYCKENLTEAAKAMDEKVDVYDITEIILVVLKLLLTVHIYVKLHRLEDIERRANLWRNWILADTSVPTKAAGIMV